MLAPGEFAGNITSAATSLCGLLLVFIGATNASFKSYAPADQSAVVGRFRWRAWLALTGFLFALAAVAASLAGRWTGEARPVEVAVACLVIAFFAAAVAAIRTVLDITAP